VLTESEQLFEDFCKQSSFSIKPIPVGKARSPDYVINVSGIDVVCEVKGIKFSREEKEAEAALERGEMASFGGTIGAKVRKQIDKGYPQIREYAGKGQCPGVLVLWEEAWVPRHLKLHNILAAMYGFDTVVAHVHDDGSLPTVVDRRCGPKKRVSVCDNKSLSAIVVIRFSNYKDSIECSVYHNKFALKPLPLDIFNIEHVWQYKLANKVPNEFDSWEYIE